MLKRVKRKNRPAQNAAGRFLYRVFFYVDVLGYLLLKGSTELIALLCDGAAVAQAVDGADAVSYTHLDAAKRGYFNFLQKH